MYRFKVSKYKNSAPKIPKKEQWITEIPLDHVMHSCGNFVKASGKHIAFNVESGGGGCAGILPLDATGRRNKKVPTIYAHPEFLTDMDFSPFDDDLLATCSYDGFIKLWTIPENFEETLDNPTLQLSPTSSNKRVESVLFHPSAENVLASIVHDNVEIFDLHKGESSLSCSSSSGENFQSISWKLDGSQIISSNKDTKNRIIDPRTEKVVNEFQGFAGQKDSRIIWMGNHDYVLGTGFSKTRQRMIALWDVRNTSTRASEIELDTSNGTMIPLLDADTNMVFMAGKGDSYISLYEFNTTTKVLSMSSSDSIGQQMFGVGMTPKRVMNVMEGEVDRLFVLAKNLIVPLPYIIPRKSYRDFHADLFPDTVYSGIASMSSEEWFSGENTPISKLSLDPKKAKEKPKAGGGLKAREAPTPTAPSQASITPESTSKPAQVNRTPPASSNSKDPEPAKTTEKSNVAEQKNPALSKPAPVVPVAAPPARTTVNLFKDVHQSKFKHLLGEFMHKSVNIENIRNLAENLPGESDGFQCFKDLLAIPLTGAGGQVLVLKLSKPGRLADTGLATLQNGCNVLDIAMDPFDNTNIAVACEDWSIKLWKVPEGGLKETMHEPEAVLQGHDQRVTIVKYHPVATNILASASFDNTVRVWDLSDYSEIGALGTHGDQVLCMAWHPDGKYLATFCKDRMIRIFDPVNDTDVMMEGEGPATTKGARMCWCGPGNNYIVVSTTGREGRELHLFNSEDLSELAVEEVDESPSVLSLHYDEGSSTLFCFGKGDRVINCYEISEDAPHIFALSQFKATGLHQAVCFLQKNLCDVRKVEFARAVRLTKSSVETVQFTLPRVKTQFFQDDIFPDARVTWIPGLTGDEWLDEVESRQEWISLKPDDMISLSDAPKEEPKVAKYSSAQILAEKSDAEKKEELINAMMDKLDVDDKLEQDEWEGVDEDEWDD